MKNGLVITKYGTKCWYKNDLLHREDGPAVIFYDGIELYYFNNKLLAHDKWLLMCGNKTS
jgi:hypothetical protein